MNKIYLENEKIIKEELDEKIKYDIFTNDTFGITSLTLEIIEDTDLELNYNFKEKSKIETIIIVNKDVNLQLFEKIEGNYAKIRTKYYLKENSKTKTSKFNNIKELKEYTIINLDEENAKIEYNLKTIAEYEENYDILTYHNANNTVSKINPNGVNMHKGKIKFNVSSFVPKGKIKCDAEQDNKIINLTENECIITPNLYIDEYDVTASHSAWIGSFKEEELFYLESRGINFIEATKLLVKGFLTNKLEIKEEEKEKIKNIIDEYWR
jgi:Fe-S cluster assembly protein SufD